MNTAKALNEEAFLRSYVQSVEEQIQSFLAEQIRKYAPIALEVEDFISPLKEFFQGAKYLRPQVLAVGAISVKGEISKAELPSIIELGAAVEFVQAAALIHDDVIDAAPTRRGRPSLHIAFAEAAASNTSTRANYGTALAIVLGDLALTFAEQLAQRAYQHKELAAITEFNALKSEVMIGQFLDIANQHNRLTSLSSPQAAAELVTRWKTVPYTTLRPLLMGASFTLENPKQHSVLLDDLTDFAIEIGSAFQLRDDLLGVFGKESVTGKSVTSDLKEGKRTVLIAKAYEAANQSQAKILDEFLGNPNASDQDLAAIREVLIASQAKAAVEEEILRHTKQAKVILAQRLSLSAHKQSLPYFDYLLAKATSL